MDEQRVETGRTPEHPGVSAQLAQVGSRLRVAREERGLTMSAVANLTGLTKGFISQVERGLASASLASLASICEALTLPMGRLFDPPSVFVSRAAERGPAKHLGQGVEDIALSPPGQRNLQIIETWVDPLGQFDHRPYRLPVDREFALVLEGRLELEIEAERFTLGTGDTVSFDARHAHLWRNPSTTERTRILWVLTSEP